MKTNRRSEFGQRLFDARKHAKLTQQELAKAVGTSQPNVGELEKKGNGSALTPAIAKLCGVSIDWLAYGQGEMFLEQSKQQAVSSTETVERRFPKTIGERLKAARRDKNWSQMQLAVAAGLTTSAVGNIESGIRQSPGSQPRLADALGVSLAWLAYGQGDMLLPPLPSKQQALLSPKALALGQLFDLMPDQDHLRNEAFAAATCAILSFVDNKAAGGGDGEDQP